MASTKYKLSKTAGREKMHEICNLLGSGELSLSLRS